MSGVHEDRPRTSPFLYAVYHVGDVVRRRDVWGVVIAVGSDKYRSRPTITWLHDDAWLSPRLYDTNNGPNISAPYSFNYEGIPDAVLAKATAVKLGDGT